MRLVFKRLLGWAAVIALMAAGAVAGWAGWPVSLSGSPLEVVIQPGSSALAVARQLRRGGVEVQPQLFALVARATGRAARLKAGGYEFETGATPLSILGKMARGEFKQHAITLIEGWNVHQMRAAVDAEPALQHDTAGLSDADLMRRIGAPQASPEGLFFPDTYLFTRGSRDVELYRQAYQAMQKRLAGAWNRRAPDLPYKTPYEALVMASIIEKETGQQRERPMVASVFVNRLRRNMLLQTDPTVIYGMGASFDGNLRKIDLQTDTPYNTYTRIGLPPTPIALPGRAALEAALNPASSDALYFVARGDGTSQFSINLADHQRAVNQYQRGQP